MAKSNFPAAQVGRLSGEKVAQAVNDTIAVSALASGGVPVDAQALHERIAQFFEVCASRNLRLGIETMCAAIGTDRTSFFRWCNGERRGKDKAWTDVCKAARQQVAAFLEVAGMSGNITPVTYIWLSKNWLSYKDSVEITAARSDETEILTVDQLPDLSGDTFPQHGRALSLSDVPDLSGDEDTDTAAGDD